jgi:hypothetical protein
MENSMKKVDALYQEAKDKYEKAKNTKLEGYYKGRVSGIFDVAKIIDSFCSELDRVATHRDALMEELTTTVMRLSENQQRMITRSKKEAESDEETKQLTDTNWDRRSGGPVHTSQVSFANRSTVSRESLAWRTRNKPHS